jgi:hypothetical protein
MALIPAGMGKSNTSDTSVTSVSIGILPIDFSGTNGRSTNCLHGEQAAIELKYFTNFLIIVYD